MTRTVLKVTKQSEAGEIRANHLRLSRLVHPDKCRLPQAAEASSVVNQVQQSPAHGLLSSVHFTRQREYAHNNHFSSRQRIPCGILLKRRSTTRTWRTWVLLRMRACRTLSGKQMCAPHHFFLMLKLWSPVRGRAAEGSAENPLAGRSRKRLRSRRGWSGSCASPAVACVCCSCYCPSRCCSCCCSSCCGWFVCQCDAS